MKKLVLLLLLLSSFNIFAQTNLLNITPSNGETNVQLSTTVSVEFDQAIDTTKGFEFFENFFTNVLVAENVWYSSDLKTANFEVNLESEKNYYFLVYSVNTISDDVLENPTVAYFTTAGNLTGHTVTGTVSVSGISNLDLSNTIVAFSSTPIGEGEPMIQVGGFANAAGEYTIPNVNTGSYYPLAANDANQDGYLDPSGGDAFSFLDQLLIDSDYSDLDFVLSVPDPLTIIDAFDIADSLKQLIVPANSQLKSLTARKPDSLGNSSEWGFYFVSDTPEQVTKLSIDQFGHRVETYTNEWEYQSLLNMDPLASVSNSADIQVFMSNAEAAGGKTFRNQDMPSNFEFSLELILADHRYSYLSNQNPDTTKHIMWAAYYRWYQQTGEDEWEIENELIFFGDYEDGSLIITDVEKGESTKPVNFELGQNFPNPFNPTTVISYSIPQNEFVTVKIFDILGNELKTLVSEFKVSGNYKIEFDASTYPSGTYFYQINANNFTSTKKMLLLK